MSLTDLTSAPTTADTIDLAPRPGGPMVGTQARKRAAVREERRKQRDQILGRSPLARGVAMAVLVSLAVIWLVPIAWSVVTAFTSEADAASSASWFPKHGFTWDAFVKVIQGSDLLRWMGNSLLISALVTVLTVLISAMAAYAFSCTQFRGRKTLMTLTVISIMIPGQILIVPLFKEMSSFGMVDTFAGVILPQIVAPVMVFILKNFFDAIPAELLDAARVDGAGPWRMFVRIVLPLSSSVLVAVAIFVFIGAWNNFLWPFIVTNDPSLMTLPVGLSTVKDAYGVQYAQTMASAVIAALPLLLIFMFFQRKIVQSFATTGLGGQ
jgi:multiple sugar transport system permease protein